MFHLGLRTERVSFFVAVIRKFILFSLFNLSHDTTASLSL